MTPLNAAKRHCARRGLQKLAWRCAWREISMRSQALCIAPRCLPLVPEHAGPSAGPAYAYIAETYTKNTKRRTTPSYAPVLDCLMTCICTLRHQRKKARQPNHVPDCCTITWAGHQAPWSANQQHWAHCPPCLPAAHTHWLPAEWTQQRQQTRTQPMFCRARDAASCSAAMGRTGRGLSAAQPGCCIQSGKAELKH